MNITREIAGYAAESQYAKLPESVRAEVARAFLNWLGCSLGGSQEPAVCIAADWVTDIGARPVSTVIGQSIRADVASASFINSMGSSILAFDDVHLPTLAHPTGPVGSALLALSEVVPTTGEDFINAFALGVEVICRISKVLLLEPAKFNSSFYINGLSAPIGVAVAYGRLLGFDEQRMRWAIGLAASQSSGFRAVHGTMNSHFRPGHATRAGVIAAQLAERGFNSTDSSLEAGKGFFDVFSSGADLNYAVDRLGEEFEILQIAYKPYPCGQVTQAAVDACLEIKHFLGSNKDIDKVVVTASPLTFSLNGHLKPTTPLEAQISVYHWVAAALARGRAGLAETRQDCIDDPEVARLRNLVEGNADETLGKDETIVEVRLKDGASLRAHVTEPRGSVTKPMTDDELDLKFLQQSNLVLDPGKSETLRTLCRNLSSLENVGIAFSAALSL